jgi:hypothetical protein
MGMTIKVKKNKVLNEKQLFKLNETLKNFKCLIPRYLEVKDSFDTLYNFCTEFRSPLWDYKIFKTELVSEGVKNGKILNKSLPKDKKIKFTDEHIISRTLAVRVIFDELIKNPNMTLDEFIDLMWKYNVTIKITVTEHKLVPILKNVFYKKTINIYKDKGTIVPGLEKYMVHSDNILYSDVVVL